MMPRDPCNRTWRLQVLLWAFLWLGVVNVVYCYGSDDNRCGVHCVFLVEQHFRVGNGNFLEVLQAFEPIGPKGISLDAMRRHVESKGLFGKVYESSAQAAGMVTSTTATLVDSGSPQRGSFCAASVVATQRRIRD